MIDRSLGFALLGVALAGLLPPVISEAQEADPFAHLPATIACEGAYSKHLQGVCTNDRDALYWSFTVDLVKTDLSGKVIRRLPVADHHGDLCHHDGKIYVAVNLGAFNQPAGEAESWIYVYDAETLDELGRIEVPELVHGAGGIAYQNGTFLVVGGLPEGIEENYLYEYDESLAFRRRIVLPSGYTRLGIQTAAFVDGHWWFGCYGSPPELLKTDRNFRIVGRWNFDAALGIVGIGHGRVLVASGPRDEEGNHLGVVHLAEVDDATGLRPLDTPNR
ncbi:hypothetical protein [Tautonia rosea]|uniref:hypothetical protein n=1 Tax=Tautonia rosea TaxID=2728037 RepID=UPI0019D06841|nr:hypothetical protein [Tautonia rosea]